MSNQIVDLLNILYFCPTAQQKPHKTINIMFGLFKQKSKQEKLQNQYEKLMKESHKLSTMNRKMSDQKAYEANEVMKQLEKLS